MGGGAWPFLVGGVICLVNSDNERDLNLLNSGYHVWFQTGGGGFGLFFLVLGSKRLGTLSLLRGTIDV
jgi:hypothetical protein